MKRRMPYKLLALAALLAPSAAMADPITIVAALQPIIGGTAAAFIASNIVTIATTIVAAGVSISQRNRLKRKAAAARARYLASLSDRAVTQATIAPPYRVIYGRAETGGEIVDVLTSDLILAKFMGVLTTHYDAYKHLIIVWSHRRCTQIHEIKIDGVPVGPLDGGGWATSQQWRNANPESVQTKTESGEVRTTTVPSGAVVVSVTLAAGAETANGGAVPSVGPNRWQQTGDSVLLPGTVEVAGVGSVTPSEADTWEITYLTSAADGKSYSAVRVSHHLGFDDQTVDEDLHGRIPDRWTTDHRLRGRCYSVVQLDLQRPQFQGGPPNITADISGAAVLDPRTGAVVWSDNPALIHADWLQSELGHEVDADDIDWDSVIAAANACDEVVDFNIGDEVHSGPRYTCNGVITSEQDKETVRLDLCESMAGWSHPEGKWRILAGVWTPPVMDLDDNDLDGSIDILQTGEASSDLFNGMRGQYIPASSGTPADFESYQNEAFVEADGRALWRSEDFNFTNTNARCKNLARIAVEQSRNGLVIFFPAKMKAWPLQVGDRVRVNSLEYGFDLKTFRVNEWNFGLRAPVGLMLQEDAPEAWDEADAALPDPTPNTTLPDPWFVAPIEGLGAESGTSVLIRQADGTIISRVRLTWDDPTASYLEGGFIEVKWRPMLSDAWSYMNVGPFDTEAFITGVQDNTVLIIGVTVFNGLRMPSKTVWVSENVIGKTEAPPQVTGLAAARALGALVLTRDEATVIDWGTSIYEYSTDGSNWHQIETTPSRTGAVWTDPVIGGLQIRAHDVDTSGNHGLPDTISVTVAPDDIAAASSTLAIKINSDVFGPGINYNEAYIHGFDASGAAADVDGSIRVNGAQVTVPKGAMYGGQGPVSCVIVWDMTGAGFPSTVGVNRPYAIARRYNNAWQYDNNSAWTPFTPTASHFVIGQIEVGGVDTGAPGSPPGIIVATMLADAQLLSAIPGDSVLLNPGDALNQDPYVLDSSKWEHIAYSGSPVQFLDGANSPGAKGSAYMSSLGAGERFEFDNRVIPIDPSRTYNFSANLFAASGNNRNMYLVVRMFRANGSEVGGADTGWGGTFAGYTFGGLPATDQFTVYGADFGAGTPRTIPADVVSVRIGIWFQYAGGGSSAVQQAAQYVRLTDVTGARAASAAAATAQSAANAAQSSANSALGTLSAMRSNGVLDAGEKPSVIKEWLQIAGERAGIEAQANVYGIFTERNSYTAAHDNLNTYLSSLSPPYNDTSSDTLIVPATDQATWTSFYNARQALLNKIADAAGKVANWTGVTARPATFRVGARGASATGYPISSTVVDADGNFQVVAAAAMYRVAKIHRLTRVWTDLGAFNPLSGALGALGECNAMAAALNSIDSSHICVVFTFDEPATNRLLGDLPAAMYRNGASRSVWGSMNFQYRGAYILVGVGGCGEGNGAENYAGAVNSDVNAWCDTTFQLSASGALVVSGTSRGATTLLDFGYVGTAELAQGAATNLATAKRATASINHVTDSTSSATVSVSAVTLSLTNTLSPARSVTVEVSASAALTFQVASAGPAFVRPNGLNSQLTISQYDGAGNFVASHGDAYSDPTGKVDAGDQVTAYKSSMKRVDLPPGHRLDASFWGEMRLNQSNDGTLLMRDAVLNFTEIRA